MSRDRASDALGAGMIELDLHGRTQYQARVTLNACLRRARPGARIRVIHGATAGAALRDMLRAEYPAHPRVLRVVPGENDGRTILILN